MDEQLHTNEYRTGRTHPKKSRSGLLAVLLICVIFLGGIISVLSFANIRLFRQIKQWDTDDDVSLSFRHADAVMPSESNKDHTYLAWEGMALLELPTLYRRLYDLPKGLYISQVRTDSPVKTLGIAPGDVLVCVNGIHVSSLDALQELLRTQHAGDQVNLLIYRRGHRNSITFSLVLSQ